MKPIEKYIRKEDIIFLLCRGRAKIAKRRNKEHLIHLLSSSEEYNYHKRDEIGIDAEICQLFPSRKKWKKIGETQRRNKHGNNINSIDKNIRILLTTIKWYEKYQPNAQFLKRLNHFIFEVQNSINDVNYQISSPFIIPKLKESKKKYKNVCRPISNFSLKDKIIICLINRYLTDLLDGYFYEKSLAFRSVRESNGKKEVITHHHAIRYIKEYAGKHSNSDIWISECDMKKFYDTVNHHEIERRFKKLMIKVFMDTPDSFNSNAIRIFYSYLDCYSFNKNVCPLDQQHFDQFTIEDGSYEWVESELSNYYGDGNLENIGIPQGGALSGLIANIVLNTADSNLSGYTNHKDILYLRYCDDMIILSPNKRDCEYSIQKYSNTLKKLKLVPHDFMEAHKNGKEFWKTKSKKPYKWGFTEGSVHWIGFVGYEINRKGDIRVRRSSLRKEMTKQCKIIGEARKAIQNNNRRASRGYISESIIHRLIGMSVGRISLWNFDQPINDLCWMNGFKEINKNPHSVRQYKMLDRNRNKHYRQFVKELTSIDNIDDSGLAPKTNRQIIYFGKPFSYYYQALEKTDKT